MSVFRTLTESKAGPAVYRRSLANLLAPLEQLAKQSPNLFVNRGANFELGGESYELPRYRFVGARGGDAPIRVGLFAAIHGDEPEGAYALIHFLTLLDSKPDLAAGYHLSIYPVCNPSGFEDYTRHARGGKDLNREFWKSSNEPEVRLLQAELVSLSFHGLISLRTHTNSDGFYGMVRGATLTRNLIEPALNAAEIFLPRDERTRVDGLRADNGVVHDGEDGALSAPPKVRPRPFEIVLSTPKAPPSYLKECAFIAALRTIFVEYRKLMAYAQNL